MLVQNSIIAGSFEHGELIIFFLSLAILIGTARILGEVAEKFKQPAVLGELSAGIVLGPSVLGIIAPEINATLFPSEGAVTIGLDFISSLAIALFLLLAGMEIDLRNVWKQGKTALSVSVGGMVIPFGIGLATAFYAPQILGKIDSNNKLAFALFFATALSISALPVIARILMDLKLNKSHFGVIVLTAAIVNDLLGWLIFAMVLGMIGANGIHHSLAFTFVTTLLFAGFMFTLGTKIIERIYPWIQAHLSWPAGTLNFIVVGGLFCAAFTEWIGIHAIFGTFIFGVAVGQCTHIRAKTLHTLDSFISFIITPIFFASVGLKVNFVSNFDLSITVIVLVIGTIGKVGGSWLGGKFAGLSNKESLAIGSAMNARGVMEIILGLIAYQAGLISETLFVALVIFALLTSMTSGALVQKILKRKSPIKLVNLLKKDRIKMKLNTSDRFEILNELCTLAAIKLKIDPTEIKHLVKTREEMDSTGIENGIAIPHCRIKGIKEPAIFLGLCPTGANFESFDQNPSKVIFLIITQAEDPHSQLEIISQIGSFFAKIETAEAFVRSKTTSEIIAYINSHDHHKL